MNPMEKQQQAVVVTFESQEDIVNFVARPLIAPGQRKFNAAMRAMREQGADVTYHPMFGNEVVYRVDGSVNLDPDTVESVLRQVYACRKRNQMIVATTAAVVIVAAALIMHSDDDEDSDKKR